MSKVARYTIAKIVCLFARPSAKVLEILDSASNLTRLDLRVEHMQLRTPMREPGGLHQSLDHGKEILNSSWTIDPFCSVLL